MTENRRPGELFERSVSRYRQDRPRRRTGRVTFEDKMTGEPAGSARSRGTCRYLKVSTWHSDTWRAIPAKSQARLLYLHLLTGPHTLAYHVPGLYQVGQHALCEAMELRRREFTTAMKTLIASAGVRIDRGKGILMDGHGLGEAEAYRRIRLQSMNLRKTMKEVADAIILAKSV